MAEVRRAVAADAARMAYVAEQSFAMYLARMDGRRPVPMDADYAAAVAEAESWVAMDDGEFVGYLVLVEEEDGFVLDNLAVLPSHHGRGIGRALLELAEERSLARGFRVIRLYTHVTMVENQRLYEGIGYVETGRETVAERSRVLYEKVLDPR